MAGCASSYSFSFVWFQLQLGVSRARHNMLRNSQWFKGEGQGQGNKVLYPPRAEAQKKKHLPELNEETSIVKTSKKYL